MKQRLLFFLALASFFNCIAQQNTKIGGDYFLIEGVIMRSDFPNKNSEIAPYTQVVIYQDDDLFVTFFADESGHYSFYLPISKTYTMHFGGSAYINKKIQIDATQLSKERKPRELNLDVELFREVEGVEFPMMAEYWQIIKYNPESDQLMSDNVYHNRKKMELEKLAKKLRKIKAKEKPANKS
jgi:hypothetical protein